MNRVDLVGDVEVGLFQNSVYDLAIFASGHEERASHVSTLLSRDQVKCVCVFGFDSGMHEGARLSNDAYFRKEWGEEPLVFSNRAESGIYSVLSKYLAHKSRVRVLVDYSSMTRFWYAAILNWLRYNETFESIEIDLVYCAGEYVSDIPALEIDSILSIPGCEGNTASAGPSVTLLGLGFDSRSVQCVIDDLEPDIVKPFIAAGTARGEYIKKVKAANADLLQRCGSVLELPLQSVATTLTCLGEVIIPYCSGFNVSIVPLGPKPHVLASILLAMKFPQVTALHVSGMRSPPWNAKPTSQITCTRVSFKNGKAA